jgi:transcriptional regulator with XRE-family HTH domain
MDGMDVLTRIQDLCHENKMSLRQLSEKVGIGNGVIGKWKDSSPRVDTLSKVAKHFNVSLDYITGLTDVKNIDKCFELESIVENLLNELNNQSLTFNGESIDSDMVEIIQSMLKSNLEVWTLMNEKRKYKRNL